MQADILSYAQITAALVSKKYIPITEYSLRPYTIAHILNDIIINKRKTIIEFGSGSSTVFIASLIEKNNLNAKLYSVDHDKNWLDLLRKNYLSDNDSVHFIHAALTKTKNGILPEQNWYDEQIIYNIFNDIEKADLIIIDGPPGDVNDYARYPAVNFINNFLKEEGAIIVDDISRDFEKRIVNDLVELHGYKENRSLWHSMLTKRFGFCTNPLGRVMY
jgi:precorrin-6B methylase 2